ncbi:MAG: hypothetical protein RLZ12_217 [Bacillota bacterium]|jgi:hypothetical protein
MTKKENSTNQELKTADQCTTELGCATGNIHIPGTTTTTDLNADGTISANDAYINGSITAGSLLPNDTGILTIGNTTSGQGPGIKIDFNTGEVILYGTVKCDAGGQICPT